MTFEADRRPLDPHPRVTLFSTTYNQRERAVETLRDALAQDYPEDRLRIVMLDDGSSDGTIAALREVAAEASSRVTLIEGRHDADYQSARLWNRCIAAAAADTEILIQVDDVRLRSDFVASHVGWHRLGRPHIVSGAKFEGPEETWELAACRRSSLAGQGSGPRVGVPATAMWGASLSYPRWLAEAASRSPSERPFDEAMSGYGYHEVELAYRMQRAGGLTVYDPAAGVFHRDHDDDGEQRRGFDRRQIVERGLAENELYFLSKHRLAQLPRW